MKSTTDTTLHAMAFHHSDGFVPTYQQALRFAGEKGRIATLPDIIDARLAADFDDRCWDQYYTTASAEYVGYGHDGTKLIIISHAGGPLSTKAGIIKAYKYQYDDKTRDTRGGRITRAEFLKLEAGEYGPVAVINLESYLLRYKYPFIGFLTEKEALNDPILKARLGPRAEEFIRRHAEEARTWHEKSTTFDPVNRFRFPTEDHAEYCARRRKLHALKAKRALEPFLVEVEQASNCPYKYLPEADSEMAVAHLLVAGGVSPMHHGEEEWDDAEGRTVNRSHESLIIATGCHSWSTGTRLVGITDTEPIVKLHPGWKQANQLILEHWEELCEKVNPPRRISQATLMQNAAGDWFTQREKKGNDYDSYEPEHPVLSVEPLGTPVTITVEIQGHYVIFTYDSKEAWRLAPPNANGYALASEPKIVSGSDPKYHRVDLQFYTAEIDGSRLLPRREKVANDFDLLMRLGA